MTRHINNWNLPSGSSLSSTWSRRSQFGKSKFTRIIRFLIGLIVFMLVLCSIFPLIKYSNAGEGLSGVVGILTVPEKIARRKLLRSTYMTNVPMRENFKIYFVFCKPDEKIKWILAEEQRLHNDIIIMDCVENMNEGKTYTWFKTAYSQFNPSNGRSSDGVKYDYVFKADDDVWVHIPNLIKSFQSIEPLKAYYGRLSADERFMVGMLYGMSWDLVEYIATSTVVASMKTGGEDQMAQLWLEGQSAKLFNQGTRFYDHPWSNQEWRLDYHPDTIAIHQCKEDARIIDATRHFMGTDALAQIL